MTKASRNKALRKVGERSSDYGSAREQILDHAERMFADLGYDGVSMRKISLASETPVALISYHFGGKSGLYRAVFERSLPESLAVRQANLDLAQFERDAEKRLELIIAGLVLPAAQMRGNARAAASARLFAREVSDPAADERGIIRELFDPMVRQMISALHDALPDRTAQEINWAFQFMLGALVFVMADIGRIARVSDGLCDPDDPQQFVGHFVATFKAALQHASPARGGITTESKGGSDATGHL